MIVQDGKGNVLPAESFIAILKQWFCIHDWIKVGQTYECPKCQSVKTINP